MKKKRFILHAIPMIACYALVAGCADADPERPLFDRLLAGDAERNAALEEVLDDARDVDAFSLLLASDRARQVGRAADAAFLLNAGRIRAAADKRAFPEADDGENRPSLMLNTLEHEASQRLGLDIASDRDAYGRVIARIEAWQPRVGRQYDPGWVYTDALSRDEAQAVLHEEKNERLGDMRGLATLLADDEYLSLIQEVKKLQDGTVLGPELDSHRLESIVRRGREIEQSMNIDGAFSSLD